MTAKQFISRLAEMKLIPLPGNIRSRRFRFNHSAAAEIETFTVDEVRALLAACDGFSERTKLYLLLMLNCGMYQNDIAELRQDEVNWSKGTLTRARSKTRERNGPVVTYKLWPETFALLKKHRAGGELALTTDEGNPLVKYWLEDGKMRRYDAIQSAWTRLAEKMGGKIRLGMKHLRKTSATMLGSIRSSSSTRTTSWPTHPRPSPTSITSWRTTTSSLKPSTGCAGRFCRKAAKPAPQRFLDQQAEDNAADFLGGQVKVSVEFFRRYVHPCRLVAVHRSRPSFPSSGADPLPRPLGLAATSNARHRGLAHATL